MFRVLKIDGPNILTDRGGVCLAPFSYADGGKTRPVSVDDLRAMRDGFLAVPDLVNVLRQAVESSGFSLAGPSDHRAAEHGEPEWVCNAREVLAAAAGRWKGGA